MSGYAKSWTEKFSDSWYLSLKLSERGMWDQLSTYCKLHGDVSLVFLRNFAHVGTEFGCDRGTASRILRKFASDGKVKLTTKNNGIEIEICNYEYWQRVKKVGDGGKSAETQRKPVGKSPLNKSREDQSIYIVQEIINDLNEVCGTDFKPTTGKTVGFINARLADGFTVGDFKAVHRVKFEDWAETEQQQYLRPKTLYTPDNFESYVNQAKTDVADGGRVPSPAELEYLEQVAKNKEKREREEAKTS